MQRLAHHWLADPTPMLAAAGDAQLLCRPYCCLLRDLLLCSACIANTNKANVTTLETS